MMWVIPAAYSSCGAAFLAAYLLKTLSNQIGFVSQFVIEGIHQIRVPPLAQRYHASSGRRTKSFSGAAFVPASRAAAASFDQLNSSYGDPHFVQVRLCSALRTLTL